MRSLTLLILIYVFIVGSTVDSIAGDGCYLISSKDVKSVNLNSRDMWIYMADDYVLHGLEGDSVCVEVGGKRFNMDIDRDIHNQNSFKTKIKTKTEFQQIISGLM